MKRILFAVLTVFIAFAMISCDDSSSDSKTWKVTFNAGTGATVTPTSKEVTKGEAAGTLPTPTKGTDTFVGWFTADSGGTAFTATTLVTGNITVYARWSSTFTVTFDAGYDGAVAINSKDVNANAAIGTLPPAPERSLKWAFLGWFDGTTKVEATTTVTAAMALVGKWEEAVVEKVSLINGAFAAYEFVLPDGLKWGDFTKLTVDYLIDDAAMTAKGIRAVRLYGNFPLAMFNEATWQDKKYSFVNLNSFNAPYIMYNMTGRWDPTANSNAGGWAGASWVSLGIDDINEWYTIEYKIDGVVAPANNSTGVEFGHGANGGFVVAGAMPNMPDNDATGPFYFCVGLAGNAPAAGADPSTTLITQYIRNVTLTNADGSKKVVSQGQGAIANPAFIAYGVNDNVQGSLAREMIE